MDNYEQQLLAVEEALKATTIDAERVQLESLKSDLIQLIELTNDMSQIATSSATTALDEEYKKFMHEMSELRELENAAENVAESDTNSNVASTDSSQAIPAHATAADYTSVDENDEIIKSKFKELKANLERMVGQKCSAPHEHNWGAVCYHNAIISRVEDTMQIGADGSLDMQLRVFFTNPTHTEMLPCNYFLEGDCRFDDAYCRFSHGELVSATAIKDYTEPKFELLSRNCYVLAKLDDRLWHRGRVLCVNFVEKKCLVRLEEKSGNDRELDIHFEDLLPMYQDDSATSSSADSEIEDNNDKKDCDALAEAAQTPFAENNVLTISSTERLGEWEKHTRGIGSKLMAKMGYVPGTGLGSDGRGIVTPVEAQILPKGCSLDYCMKLREAGNGDKNFFNIEQSMERERKKLTEPGSSKNIDRKKRRHRKKKGATAAKTAKTEKKQDVFAFLNENVLASTSNNTSNSDSVANMPIQRNLNSKFKVHRASNSVLNIENAVTPSHISDMEKDLAKLTLTMERNASNTELINRVQSKVNKMTKEIETLREYYEAVKNELRYRRANHKLRNF